MSIVEFGVGLVDGLVELSEIRRARARLKRRGAFGAGALAGVLGGFHGVICGGQLLEAPLLLRIAQCEPLDHRRSLAPQRTLHRTDLTSLYVLSFQLFECLKVSGPSSAAFGGPGGHAYLDACVAQRPPFQGSQSVRIHALLEDRDHLPGQVSRFIAHLLEPFQFGLHAIQAIPDCFLFLLVVGRRQLVFEITLLVLQAFPFGPVGAYLEYQAVTAPYIDALAQALAPEERNHAAQHDQSDDSKLQP